jgi:TonB family protein
MRAVQGVVKLEAIVEIDGRIRFVRVTQLDRKTGLDDSAIDTVKQWRFEPGRKDKTPVRTRVRWSCRLPCAHRENRTTEWPETFSGVAG